MKSTQSPTEFDQNNRDVTSIPGYVIKKNSSRGAKHGLCERQKIYYQAKQMLKKARQGKHGWHPTILSRWYADEEYRQSMSAIGWKEHHIMLYDRIVEKHIYIATRAERIQNSRHWILTINAEGGPQQPSINDPTLLKRKENANDCMTSTWQRTQEEYRTIPRSRQIRQRKEQQFADNEEYDYAVDPKTGWRFYKKSRGNLQTTSSGSRANLQIASSSSSTWDQIHWKTSK